MPRASDGTWSDIPNITAVPGQTIESADWNNYRADLRNNEFNAARPITAGGTGATNAVDALANLGALSANSFLDAFAVGDFYETIRTLDSKWLRRNGGIYEAEDYAALAALFTPLPAGVSWTPDTSPPWGSATPNGIAISPAQIIVVAGASAYRSSDGESWSVVALPVTPIASQTLAYGGGRWVIIGAGGQTTVSTDDGATWSTPTTPLQTTPQGIIFGGGAFAVTHFAGVGTSTSKISASVDGVVFADRTTPQQALYRLLISDDNGIIASDSAGYYYVSLTGDTFTQVSPDIPAHTILAGERFDGNFVFVGSAGVINTATDLTDLTARTSSTTQNLNAVIYSDPLFITVGGSGVSRISTDNGATWGASVTSTAANLVAVIENTLTDNELLAVGPGVLLRGVKTSSTQFRVPSDDPTYGWIRALPIDEV